jgi:ubiquinone/menaquinone biosynthesis C-methylase UbiE
MAREVLAHHAGVRMMVTDFDHAMVDAAAERMGEFGDRAAVGQADATALPFADDSFDAVLSWVMLHHTVEWETALREAVRVVRPGGHVIGYDLLASAPMRLLHRAETADQRIMRIGELHRVVAELPIAQAVLTPSLGGTLVRFTLRK